MTCIDAYVIPILREKLAAYRAFSADVAAVYREHGALRIVDCLLDEGEGDAAAFHAEGARAGEAVILSWTEWPDAAARDAGVARALADPRIQPKPGEEVLFEGYRLVAGRFALFLETAADGRQV